MTLALLAGVALAGWTVDTPVPPVGPVTGFAELPSTTVAWSRDHLLVLDDGVWTSVAVPVDHAEQVVAVDGTLDALTVTVRTPGHSGGHLRSLPRTRHLRWFGRNWVVVPSHVPARPPRIDGDMRRYAVAHLEGERTAELAGDALWLALTAPLRIVRVDEDGLTTWANPTDRDLYDVVVHDGLLVAGGGGVGPNLLTFDGDRWRADRVVDGAGFVDLHAVRDGLVAVGQGPAVYVLRDGAWATHRLDLPDDAGLRRVAGGGLDDLWVHGCADRLFRGRVAGWTRVPVAIAPTHRGVCMALWGAGTDVWGLTDEGAHRWDGVRWSDADVPPASPLPPVGRVRVHDVWGAAPDDVWAVGSSIRSGSGSKPLAVHWDGVRWTATDVPPGGGLLAVHGAAPDDVWAVGIDGMAVHWDGEIWTRAPVPVPVKLWGVAALDGAAVAVGEGGAILRWVSDPG